MTSLRQWNLDPSKPYAMQVATDARLSRTSYVDDQVWNVLTGTGDEPAIALHTKYGGRAGLVSLVPMWTHESHLFYQAMTYATTPVITAFTPDMIIMQAQILPDVHVEFLVRAMESQALGGMVTLTNGTAQTLKLRFDLFGHVGIDGGEQKTLLLDLPKNNAALYMGQIGNIHPVVLVEKGDSQSGSQNRLGTMLNMKPGAKVTVRFVHAGLPTTERSVILAQRWLAVDWKPFLDASTHLAEAIPNVETENEDFDAVLASSYIRVMQSFLRPAGQFPRSTFVAARTPDDGFSRKGDGSDYPRSWSGQDPLLAYLIAPVAASIDPALAKAIIANYLATQGKDGTIDFKPGAAGQRQDMLCLPLLARIAWNIFQQTEDEAFLKESFPGLLRFFERWLSPDFDKDGDSYPEWQDERQTGFMAFPTFAPGQQWAQGLNINTVESPDLPAYLLSEALALREMADHLKNRTAVKQLDSRIKTLKETLASAGDGSVYRYRDRDTHTMQTGTLLLHEGAGNELHSLAVALDTPSRLIVRVIGGVNHVPRMTVIVEGLSETGIKITEKIDSAAFLWQNRQGVATTQRVFSQVDAVHCDGLSRVYRVTVSTPDLTGLDINALLPLWTGAVPSDYAKSIVKLVTDKNHFWRTNGITMVSAQDSRFDPSSANGAGGIWMYWLTLLGEGLITAGETKKAGELMRSVLTLLAEILKRDHSFYQFYHSDSVSGSGEIHHLSGIAPLHLFSRITGINIVSPAKVWTGGVFAWGQTVTVTQHGVVVKRTSKKIYIKFPSGTKIDLAGDAPWQAVVDPKAAKAAAFTPPALPDFPDSSPKPVAESRERVIIKVEREQ